MLGIHQLCHLRALPSLQNFLINDCSPSVSYFMLFSSYTLPILVASSCFLSLCSNSQYTSDLLKTCMCEVMYQMIEKMSWEWPPLDFPVPATILPRQLFLKIFCCAFLVVISVTWRRALKFLFLTHHKDFPHNILILLCITFLVLSTRVFICFSTDFSWQNKIAFIHRQHDWLSV